jgi:hypothetical protein
VTQQSQQPDAAQSTIQLRDFGGVNVTDTRTSIEDTEFAWLENAIPVGKGNMRLVPGSGTILATVAAGITSMWGVVLRTGTNTSSLLLTINNNGSMNQVDASSGTNTVIAVAGTVDSNARLTMWKDNPVLIISPTKGYFQYTGTTTLLTISSTMVGTDIAVFSGRVWFIVASGGRPTRTRQFSAPDSFTDFTAASGGGSSALTDAAFPGPIYRLLSALEQLWQVGPGAVNAISNVATTGGVTTFSDTNIVSNVGSTFPSSVTSFFRTFLFLTPYGIYAIVGATPQKLSDKLDNIFQDLQLGTDAPAAVGTVHNVFVWVVLVPYVDPDAGLRSLLLCFTAGKWFFASAGTTLTALASVLVGALPELYVTNGTQIFQLFADVEEPVSYKIQSKLFDFGDSTQMKTFDRFGLELQSDNIVSPLVTIENELPSDDQTIAITTANTITFTGLGGVTIIFVGVGPITWVTTGLQLARNATGIQMWGNYLGWTIEGTEAVWTMSAVQMEVIPGGKWQELRSGL